MRGSPGQQVEINKCSFILVTFVFLLSNIFYFEFCQICVCHQIIICSCSLLITYELNYKIIAV